MTANSHKLQAPEHRAEGKTRHIEYNVSIESLVMHGVALTPAQANEFRTTLEAEFAARLTVRDARLTLLRNTAAGTLTINLGAADSPAIIAHAVARSLFGNNNESEHR